VEYHVELLSQSLSTNCPVESESTAPSTGGWVEWFQANDAISTGGGSGRDCTNEQSKPVLPLRPHYISFGVGM
jgi:hypothetical protein